MLDIYTTLKNKISRQLLQALFYLLPPCSRPLGRNDK